LDDLDRLYNLIDRLAEIVGGAHKLAECTRQRGCPDRGVYFFFERGETRPSANFSERIVRVGTHGLKPNSKSTLYGRLSQHRGAANGGGNHRGSIFRLHVGKALLERDADSLRSSSWGQKPSAPREIRLAEKPVEEAVSNYMQNFKVLWLAIPDDPGPGSGRGFIERNSIGLLAGREPASPNWLGNFSGNASVIRSHLWNVNHIDHKLELGFLDALESYVSKMAKGV
jgi:hypothetical protein